MKTLGLIGGMSWESTAVYYKFLNEGVRNKLGGLHSSDLILHNMEFSRIARLQAEGDWDGLTGLMVDAAEKLEVAGAEAILICTNTMHLMANAVSAAVDIPLIHIADTTAAAIKAESVERPLLLATRFTMEKDFYRGHLADKHSIPTIVPDDEARALVHDIIYKELCQGIVKPESKQTYLDVIAELRTSNRIDSVILGCTEIDLLIGQGDLDIPVFDTTAIHAAAAVDFALG